MSDMHMNRVVLIVTHLCTLKCKLCIQAAPLYKNPYNPTLDELKNEIDAYFNIVDTVDIFEISGGEPLLRKDLPEVLTHLQKYERCILKEIRVTTNCTLAPSASLLDAAALFRDKMFFLLDDYGVHSKTVHSFRSLLSERNISFRVRDYHSQLHGGGWVDFGSLSVGGDDEVGQKNFSSCVLASELGFSFEIAYGEMHPCIISKRCMEKGVVEKNVGEYISLTSKDESKEDKQHKIRAIYALEKLSACRFCNGFSKNSERFLPAEQLTAKEIHANQIMEIII